VRDALARVDRHLLGTVGCGGRRRQHLADPIGRKLERRGVGSSGMRVRRQLARSGTRTSP
jgi:hypothetical protein